MSAKLHAITKNGIHFGSILANKVVVDTHDNYLLFQLDNQTVAYMPGENIEISTAETRATGIPFNKFTEYQSNRVDS
jgi:hypothetical protein